MAFDPEYLIWVMPTEGTDMPREVPFWTFRFFSCMVIEMVMVNGEKMDLDGRALGEFLRGSGFGTDGVAVERNGVVVPGRELDGTVLSDGDVLEIVRFVGGG